MEIYANRRMMALQSLRTEIETAMAAVRSTPEAIAPRMALFQLSAAGGDWRRAKTQLETMEKLDHECTMLSRTYVRLIEAEAVRERVFAAVERPVAFGQPPAWMAMMAEALALDSKSSVTAANALRATARQETAARSGTIGSAAFEWIMDADPRIGAVLEVVVDGQYRWLPFDHLKELRAEPPKAMRDLVWQPVTLRLTTDTEVAAFVPSRYPGSESDPDDAIRLCRETGWIERNGEQWGIGQRLFASDLGDHAFLDIRRLRFTDPKSDEDG